MRDKIREKWGDIPTLVCSETGGKWQKMNVILIRGIPLIG